jgi:hypothetical protein
MARIERALLCAAVLVCSARSAAGTEPGHALPSVGDVGGIGMLQMPTARMGAPDGYFALSMNRTEPYRSVDLTVQPLPWLEGVFRYSSVENREYSPGLSQTYKDRGFDFKLRLLDEGDFFPQTSVGVRDFAGTGLFGGEYLVASRRVHDFDFTVGLGWGRIGGRGGLKNPFRLFSDGFASREATVGEGLGVTGQPQYKKWFHGEDVGVFGGVEWATPVRGLSAKVEYDGNDYQSEPLDNNLDARWPVNVGINYRLWDSLDLAAGWERGNELMLQLSLTTNFQTDKGPTKVLDAPVPPATAEALDRSQDFSTALRKSAERQRLAVNAMDRPSAHTVEVWYGNPTYRNPARAIGRLSQVLALTAPPEVDRFTLTAQNGGLPVSSVSVMRGDVQRAMDAAAGVEDVWTHATFEPAAPAIPESAERFGRFPSASYGMAPVLRQHIGGPSGFYFYQLWWRVSGGLALTERLSLSASVGFDLVNNFDGLQPKPDSELPHVRSDIVHYLKEGQDNLVRLEANYHWPLARDWYARFSAGIFEEMYGGVAGELLYRPYLRRWALGLDMNRVRQREYDQRFDFRDYEVTTGHLTLYYQLPWYNTFLRWSGGYYLAGDHGSTVDFSRLFDNGVRAGAFVTLTDLSSDQFGEGSFDKGFYVFLPWDLFFAKSTRKHMPFVFRPLTRDGGQKVRAGHELYPIVDGTDPGSMARGWPELLD